MQNTKGEIGRTKKLQNERTRNRLTHELPFTTACATLPGKTQGFVLRLPPQHKAHATLMQPFQCDLQPGIPQPHRTTPHTKTCKVQNTKGEIGRTLKPSKPACPQPPHTRAALHRRLQLLYTEKTQGFVLRLPPQHKPHATFMQPLYCDLQQGIPQPQRTTHTRRHLPNTSPIQHSCGHSNAICNQGFHNRIELRTHKDTQSAEHQGRNRENQKTPKRAYPQPPHTRAALHRRLQLLYGKNTKFCAPASSPTQAPYNSHAAIPMRSATRGSTTA